jgi:membrane protein implicated in regulation of membrane protease activity
VIALAILCLVVAAALVALMATVGFTSTITFATFAGDVHTRPFWVFLLGAATLLLVLIALSLLHRGTRRKVRRRREMKRLRKLEEESPRTAGGSPARDDDRTSAARTDDVPDRTLVRERPVDLRTPPGGTVGASAAGEEPRTRPEGPRT